jgi:uncharacterized membrane protein
MLAMARWGEFRARPFHLGFGAVAIACAVISAALMEDATLRAGWIVLGMAGLVWLGFVSWALLRQRRRGSGE